MSDREFDNYLTLVSRVLRWKPEERAALVEEFRAHLEDRFDELTAKGLPHDEAVRLALEEFGDAAGLASSLHALVRNRRRRWVVRSATIGVGGLVMALLGATLFVPATQNSAVIGPALAQDGAGAKANQGATAGKPASELAKRLERSVTVEFVATPLADVLTYLADTADVQFYVKKQKLEEAGLSTDVAVTLSLKDVKLATLLDLVLDQVGVTYVERDEILLITTPDDAAYTLEVRVYDCRELLAMRPKAQASGRADAPAFPPAAGDDAAGGIAPPTDAETLQQLLTSTIEPESWMEVGGHGSLSFYSGLLVVRQSAKTHQKLEKLLGMMQESAGISPAAIKVTR